MKEAIIRFDHEDITWLSDSLYKVNRPYSLPMDFSDYYELIGNFYKRPGHFEFKGRNLLELSLYDSFDKLIWNADTGYLNIETNKDFINLSSFNYSKWSYSKRMVQKILSILEQLNLVKILKITNKAASFKIYIKEFNEFLKKGTEEKAICDKYLFELNNIEFEGVEYIAI